MITTERLGDNHIVDRGADGALVRVESEVIQRLAQLRRYGRSLAGDRHAAGAPGRPEGMLAAAVGATTIDALEHR